MAQANLDGRIAEEVHSFADHLDFSQIEAHRENYIRRAVGDLAGSFDSLRDKTDLKSALRTLQYIQENLAELAEVAKDSKAEGEVLQQLQAEVLRRAREELGYAPDATREEILFTQVLQAPIHAVEVSHSKMGSRGTLTAETHGSLTQALTDGRTAAIAALDELLKSVPDSAALREKVVANLDTRADAQAALLRASKNVLDINAAEAEAVQIREGLTQFSLMAVDFRASAGQHATAIVRIDDVVSRLKGLNAKPGVVARVTAISEEIGINLTTGYIARADEGYASRLTAENFSEEVASEAERLLIVAADLGYYQRSKPLTQRLVAVGEKIANVRVAAVEHTRQATARAVGQLQDENESAGQERTQLLVEESELAEKFRSGELFTEAGRKMLAHAARADSAAHAERLAQIEQSASQGIRASVTRLDEVIRDNSERIENLGTRARERITAIEGGGVNTNAFRTMFEAAKALTANDNTATVVEAPRPVAAAAAPRSRWSFRR